MPSETSRRHLLSHRLRGFSPNEGSLAGLRAALACGAPRIEIDTRVTADGEILIIHDSRLDRLTRSRGPVSAYDGRRHGPVLYRHASGEAVPTLEAFVRVFAEHQTGTELFVDIKDGGFEQLHCRLIEAAGLEQRVWIISWSPEVLLAVHRLNPRIRLGFSYVPVTRCRSAFGGLLTLVGDGRPVRLLGRLTSLVGKGHNLRDLWVRTGPIADVCEPEPKGRFPVHVLPGVPGGALGRALHATHGAVGVPLSLSTHGFVDEAHRAGLKVFVFSVDTEDQLSKALSRGADIVFSNNADLVCDEPRGG
jgi:glycerophosphoryl diester phosphodiesterase